MAKEITEFMYKRLENKLQKLEEQLPVAKEAYSVAYALGDSSENSELDAAKDKLSTLTLEISNLKELLKYDIVEYDTSEVIRIGSFVKVSLLRSSDLNDLAESEKLPRLYLLEDTGGAILEGVLNTGSTLGKTIKDNLSGRYTAGKYTFHVDKIVNPDIDEFMKMYPDEETKLDEMFKELDKA